MVRPGDKARRVGTKNARPRATKIGSAISVLPSPSPAVSRTQNHDSGRPRLHDLATGIAPMRQGGFTLCHDLRGSGRRSCRAAEGLVRFGRLGDHHLSLSRKVVSRWTRVVKGGATRPGDTK